jgi:superfamily I DNA/RNA helicase
MCITFTRKAAEEMRQRASHILQRQVNGKWINTIHAICKLMLTENLHFKRLGIDRLFEIADDKI